MSDADAQPLVAFEAELAAWAARSEDWLDANEQDLLLALCERHADALVAAGDPSWPDVYIRAEKARLERHGVGCGTEGLLLMSMVYQVGAARARRHEALGGRANVAAALAVWQEIADDPNGTGRFAVAEVRRVRWIARGVPAALLVGGAPALALRLAATVAAAFFLPVLLDGALPLQTRSMAAFFPILAGVLLAEGWWRGRRRTS